MRTLLIVFSTFLLLATGADAAGGRAPRDPSKIPTVATPDEIAGQTAQLVEQCMNDWEPATHMTKLEWRRTCERLVQDRAEFMQQQARGGRTIDPRAR